MMGTCAASSRAITSASGTEAMKQTSSAPGAGIVALGSNSLPFSCRLIFAEALELHPEHARVEIDARARVGGGQHDVVEVVDHRRARPVRPPYLAALVM
jgi:hypothetical protein